MTDERGQQERGLRRELRFWEAIALSIAIMAPGAAMALNGTATAGLVGRAVPLVFVLATVGILFVSYAFIRLTSYFNHAGSVYALSGATLGPRAGFFSGWALLGTYLCFTAGSTAEVGLFGQEFLASTGLPEADWVVIALVAAAIIWVLAFGDVRVVTRALLSMEGLTVALILVLVVVIFARIFGGAAPGGQGFTLSAFALPGGVDFGTLGLATVFGILSFAGSRMLFALCRDGFLSRRLGETSERTGAPANALAAVMVVGIITFVILRIGGVSAVNAFFYPATIGVLTLLVAYIVTNVGALRFLFLSRRVPTWEAVFPVVGLAILLYVIYKNVYPPPDFPFNIFPYIAAAWLLVGVGSVLFVPGLARRIGANLAEREGVAAEGEREPA
jgi:amino acid transporter